MVRRESMAPLFLSLLLLLLASASSASKLSFISNAFAAAPQRPPTPAQRSSAGPSLTIFCAPKPYSSVLGPSDRAVDGQRRALLSWLRLSPAPTIVLIGNDSTFHHLARQYPNRVFVDSAVDTNFLGVPQFHSIVARAQAADTDMSMIINGDIILLNDVMTALQKTHSSFPHWVMTAARWDVAEDFPYSFEANMWARRGKEAGSASVEDEIRDHARKHGSLHTYGGVDFWAWNNSPVQLFAGVMPPFSFGRGKYDNWFTHEIVAAGLREMVDASEAVTSIHVAHSYSHVKEAAETKGAAASAALAGKSFWSTRKKSSWELFANINMAQTYGSYVNQKGTALHIPWKMVSCVEPELNHMCLHHRARPATCSCEFSPFVHKSQSDPTVDPSGTWWACGSVSVDRGTDYSIQPLPSSAPGKSAPGLPHTMEQILPLVAREVDGYKVVTLVAVTFGYAEMLMSFVCRLRGLGAADNLVVAALDEDLYKFAFTQGLAVYYQPVPEHLKALGGGSCTFGSQCFRQFTKLKSRNVLRVLQAGYSVLWTDVDITWFKDPLPDLMAFGPGTFPIQSNEPDGAIPGTGIRRINSGFYFARSDPATIAAFDAIVAHAATTKLSEQPSFYDILCGVKGELVVRGRPGVEECVWNRLRTIFLDRTKYPNGAVHDYWKADDVLGNCVDKGCLILHNNWIAGKDAKKDRFVVNSFWHYDSERRMCTWSWHGALPAVHPGNQMVEEVVTASAAR